MADDLTISSVTDSQEIVDAVAQNDEGGARTGETAFVSEELPGISRTNNSDSPPRPVHAVSFEHPQSSRIRVQQELDEAEKELSSEQPASEEVEANLSPALTSKLFERLQLKMRLRTHESNMHASKCRRIWRHRTAQPGRNSLTDSGN